jgi:hypothetical protein
MNKEPVLVKETDKIMPVSSIHKPFIVTFPGHGELEDGFHYDRKGRIIWYTDGTKPKEALQQMYTVRV